MVSGHDKAPFSAQAVVLLAVVVVGVFDGLCQGAVFGEAAQLGPKYAHVSRPLGLDQHDASCECRTCLGHTCQYGMRHANMLPLCRWYSPKYIPHHTTPHQMQHTVCMLVAILTYCYKCYKSQVQLVWTTVSGPLRFLVGWMLAQSVHHPTYYGNLKTSTIV